VTTEHGLYVTDAALEKVQRHTVVDPLYSVDLARFVDGAFLDDRRVLAISENKSFVVLRETERGSTGGVDSPARRRRRRRRRGQCGWPDPLGAPVRG
jgi:hypothetical protein